MEMEMEMEMEMGMGMEVDRGTARAVPHAAPSGMHDARTFPLPTHTPVTPHR